MWGVLCWANPDLQTDSKIYGIYTTFEQALKSIQGTDGSFEYDVSQKDDEVIIIATSKTDASFKVKYSVKEFRVDV